MTTRKSNSVSWVWLVPLAVIIMEATYDLIIWMRAWYLFSLGLLSPWHILGLQLLVDLPMFALVFAYYVIGSTGHKTRIVR